MQRYDEQIRPLACQAARRAIAAAGIAPAAISHVVTVSCTGFAAPGFDVALIAELELRPTVERTHVGFMGCHGALNGLRVARALTGSDPAARVLLCAAELCSLHFQYGWDSDLAVANALFADGAAALVGASEPVSMPGADPDPARAFWRVAASGSCLVPGTADVMTWRIGDHGFEMTLSPRVSQLIATHLRPWLVGWLDRQGLGLRDVASWAIHPGGPRVIDAVQEALALDQDATACSRAVLAACGNVSSPTVLLILERLRQSGAGRPCVALAFGPGLTIEATLFT
jgi:predicted naringenin-chalcone synthase